MPSSPPPAAPPSAADMIAAIRAVKRDQAVRVGMACLALRTGGTALPLAELAVETSILAGLDIACETLLAAL